MDRRAFLMSGAALAAATATPAFARGPAGPQQQATGLYDRVVEQMLRDNPETATGLGLDTGARAALKARLDDRSPANRLRQLKPLADARAALKGVDRKALSGRAASDFDTIAWMSDISAEIAKVPYGGVDGYTYPVPYIVSQLTGAYQSVPDFLDSQHTIETREDAEAYLARLEAFPKAIEQETDRARADGAAGVVPPDFILGKTLKQLASLRGQSGESAGLVASIARRTKEKGIDGDWGARATKIVDGPLAAALDRQIALLKSWQPKAVHDAGVARLPRGEAYYAMCLRFQTSTGLTPAEAHKLGLSQVAEIVAQADALLKQQGLSQGTVGARLTALGQDPKYLYPNTDDGRAALLADLNVQVDAIRKRLPDLFAHLPKANVEVRRVPPAIELGAPRGYSQSSSVDGSRPGAYYINLVDTQIWPKWALPTLTYHESLPGHHLQGALALEAEGTPLLHKTLGFNAYNEGWALYAEQLALESGMYEGFEVGKLGFLQSMLYRAVRIVLDTGMHAMGWSREKAIAYMVETVGLAPGAAESEVERYCVWPGQACGYKIGHIEMVRLREQAKAKLGARFDLKGFHDAVLLGGAMPLDVLGRVVDDWTATRMAKAA
ncbi:DUF885 family protein [Caulobacter sp. 17J65-9]|uniref:DUF885 domain-containing protein n=1 Tax=Caulobacter sp. 17J65-9 TaxID=2709382 RepID=UPI0013CB6FDE|nr:DUF885 family protein [Caulobacter sp. 17J65-9]NEX91960.1 DUF885 family protein [Caulobacter sp. 17J65-9]